MSEEFVGKFLHFWDGPTPERLPEILHPDVVLTQPMAKPMHGIVAVQNEFRKIWRLFPDMRLELDRWAGDDETLFVEFRLLVTVENKPVEWRNVDRFVLRDGTAIERANYFDPLAVLRQLPARPGFWRRWWTSSAARPWWS